MFDELLPWYERELAFLKSDAAAFAKKYPDRAGRLDLHEHDTEHLDPHAERLIQAVALLAARVRVKLEDRFPELTDTLLELLFPHYLASIPSASIAQFTIDPEQGRVTTRHPVAAKTPLLTRPIDGETCRYRTCFDLDVWPLEVASLRLDSPVRAMPRAGSSARVVSAVRLRLSAPSGAPLSDLGMDRLRLHLHGLPEVAHGLYRMLLRDAIHVELVGQGPDGAEIAVPLRASALRPVGFEADEGLLEYPSNSFLGFRLLQELFVLPEKFLFVDLTGLEAIANAGFRDWMEIHVFCSAPPPFGHALQASNVLLNCTPVVNLFERNTEINLDLRRGEYLIVADSRRRKTTETWAVKRVTAQPVEGPAGPDIAPLFEFEHGSAIDGNQLTWAPRRSIAADGGGEISLSIGLPKEASHSPLPQTLLLQVLCTNRNLPLDLKIVGDPQGDGDRKASDKRKGEGDRKGDFFLDPMPGFLKIAAVRQPTAPVRIPVGRAAHWKLISHLALNHLSLLADDGMALRGLLELYEPTGSRAARQKIAAIQSLRSRRSHRLFDGSLLRGTEVDLLLDGGAFTGTGHYLFAAVLDRFLGMYASLNSFTQLRVIDAGNREDMIAFPPRAGFQDLV